MGNVILRQQLKKRTAENTDKYGFKDHEMIGKVVSVYDGDTCHVVVRINGAYQVINVRCYGYDSPEMKPSKKDVDRDDEIAHAKAAKAALEELVLNEIVTLKIHGFDKYGRFLANIYLRRWCRRIDISAHMVSAGHGTEYFGGTKKKKFELNEV